MNGIWPRADAYFYKIDNGKIIKLKNSNDIALEFYNYAQKFKNSSHIVTEYILEEGDIRQLDCYFFALAFLYRHCLELVLKAIGFKYITR